MSVYSESAHLAAIALRFTAWIASTQLTLLFNNGKFCCQIKAKAKKLELARWLS